MCRGGVGEAGRAGGYVFRSVNIFLCVKVED